MANRAKANNIRNHIRQRVCLASGIVMIPKKPIREKSMKKQAKAAMLLLRSKENGSGIR